MDKVASNLLNFDPGVKEEVLKIFNGTVEILTTMSSLIDPHTANHQKRVSQLAVIIAEKFNLPKIQIEGIRIASLLHDIGKVAVPNHILSKYGAISEHEFGIIKSHPQNGYKILSKIKFVWPIDKIILQHHERIDGSGYPIGLYDDDILMETKIVSVADVVEAISSHRPYRHALGMEQALSELSQNRGTLYDESVVNASLRVLIEEKFEFI